MRMGILHRVLTMAVGGQTSVSQRIPYFRVHGGALLSSSRVFEDCLSSPDISGRKRCCHAEATNDNPF